MAFWNMRTADRQWTEMKLEANRRVCTVLRSFVSTRLIRYPGWEEYFTQARNCLYAYYTAASGHLSDNLDTDLVKYKSNLLSLNADNYLRLVCPLHMQFIVASYLPKRGDADQDSWFFLLSEGVGDMYSRRQRYIMDWYSRLEWFSDPEHCSTRLAYKGYDEIAPILGLPESDPIECIKWFQTGIHIAQRTQNILHTSDWHQAVERGIALFALE
jgi:hypothetical protein